MKTQLKYALTLVGVTAITAAPSSFGATTFTAIPSFNPDTYFSGGVTAGIDFDDGGPTQAGFTGIPASNNKAYNVTNNGVTFDITINNTSTGNQNRDRGAGTVSAPHGDLTRDFEQWYNNSGGLSDGVFSFSGLVANTEYDIDFFMYNIGAGQTTQKFFDGDSIAASLITEFTTSGNDNDQSTWSPGLTLHATSNASGEIDITVQSQSNGRLTINGVSLIQGVTIPEPSSTALLGLAGLALILRRRR
ncbi:MAG: PEP-CTERM sorting domain-containing protein [Verrucomicrobiae bacterium]|nr:PEP-CTERM sorting domain-containing protein [Verrucomicrobiae bacterium]NNJ85670.1 PEP-CTERM sorting domain-containing protein [Akkermansiaceae bacterium]